MSRWKGESSVDDESEGGGGNFEPAPRGFYTIQVADFKEDTTATTKRPCLKLTCEIADEGDSLGKKVWLTITQIPKGKPGYGLTVRALHAFGFGTEGTYDFEPSDWQGSRASVLLGIKPVTKVVDGKSYTNYVNYIEELYTANHPQPEELPPEPEAPKQRGAATPTAGAPTGDARDLETLPF